MQVPRDHGGAIDEARKHFGGGDWIDLSTGINRLPYPIPDLPAGAWTSLPTQAAMTALLAAAGAAYQCPAPMLAVAGAQAAIQMLPRLALAGRDAPPNARILGPTYNEYGAAFRANGWQVEQVSKLTALEGADLAVVVNPNNPDGRTHSRAALLALAKTVGRLVVDESFADTRPELSLAPVAAKEGVLVLRSFGKFYGLAGVRLGFVIGGARDIAALAEMAGPWPISGPALEIGRIALANRAWADATTTQLRQQVPRLDALAATSGWETVGGTDLFRLYATPNAAEAQRRLACRQIWSRVFPYSDRWLRLGLPGAPAEWDRLAEALV